MSEIEQLDDSFLDNAEVAETVVEVAEPEVIETKEAEATEVETKVEATEEKAEEVKEPEVETTATEEKSWTFSQAMDEREKRQEWEKRAKDAEEKLAAQNPESEVSVFDDEEAKFKQVDDSVD